MISRFHLKSPTCKIRLLLTSKRNIIAPGQWFAFKSVTLTGLPLLAITVGVFTKLMWVGQRKKWWK